MKRCRSLTLPYFEIKGILNWAQEFLLFRVCPHHNSCAEQGVKWLEYIASS